MKFNEIQAEYLLQAQDWTQEPVVFCDINGKRFNPITGEWDDNIHFRMDTLNCNRVAGFLRGMNCMLRRDKDQEQEPNRKKNPGRESAPAPRVGETIVFQSGAKNTMGTQWVEDLMFVISATNKDDAKNFCRKLFCRGDYVYATDTHRLHWCDKPGMLSDGEYEIITATKKQVVLQKVPNQHDSLTLDKTARDETNNPNHEMVGACESDKPDERHQHAMFLIYREGIFCNMKYVADIVKSCRDWTIFVNGSMSKTEKPMFFANYTKKAVLMPVLFGKKKGDTK